MLIQILAVFTAIAGIIQATLIVLAGVYGLPAELGITSIAILVAQLTLATVALTYLDRARPNLRISTGFWACHRALIGALILANKVGSSLRAPHQ